MFCIRSTKVDCTEVFYDCLKRKGRQSRICCVRGGDNCVGEKVKGVEPALVEDETEAVVAAVAPFQQAYLGSCITRMSDAAASAFPGGNRSLPTSAELQKFIGCAPLLNL